MWAAEDIQLFLKDLAERVGVNHTALFDDESRPWSLREIVLHARYVQTLVDCVTNDAAQPAIIHLRAALNVTDGYQVDTVALSRFLRIFRTMFRVPTNSRESRTIGSRRFS